MMRLSLFNLKGLTSTFHQNQKDRQETINPKVKIKRDNNKQMINKILLMRSMLLSIRSRLSIKKNQSEIMTSIKFKIYVYITNYAKKTLLKCKLN